MISKQNKGVWFAGGLTLVSLAAILGALLIVGGPQQARDERMDSKTFGQMLQTGQMLRCYYAEKGELPLEPRDALRLTPTDKNKNICKIRTRFGDQTFAKNITYTQPKTGTAKLCADFKRPIKSSNIKVMLQGAYISYQEETITAFAFNTPRPASGETCYLADFTNAP